MVVVELPHMGIIQRLSVAISKIVSSFRAVHTVDQLLLQSFC